MNLTLIYILATAMIGAGIGFIYVILRDNERPWPQDGIQWVGTVLSVVLIVISGSILFVAATADFGGARTSLPPGIDASELDTKAENFAFRLVEDETEKELADYEGKVVLINFWATWCAPCLDELPDLNRLQQTYGEAGLVVLTISDESRATLVDFQEETLSLQTVSGYVTDPSTLPRPFDEMREGRPVSFVIDREGMVREYFIAARDYAFFERAIMPYLQGNVAAR